MKLNISPTNIAVQVIAVALAILQRDVQHTSIDNSEPFYAAYDYIVVGAGSAGCVVARRLSDDRHVSVLLLEAGGPQSFVTDLPGMEQLVWPTGAFNWNYQIAPQKRIGLGRAQPGVYPEPKGLVLGGSSVINRMVYLRPNPRDFDDWEQTYGAIGWSFADVLPFFVKSENNSDYRIVANNPHYHGMDGPLGVASDPNLNLFLRYVQKGYNSYGIPTLDVNGPDQAGTAIVQLNIKDGLRSSTANAFIEPNPNPKNLFVSLNSFVTRVLFEETNSEEKLTATGVEFVKNGHKYTVRAKKEIILTSGSYNSPKILMLSGIGPKNHLQEVGIPTLVDLPVGYNLQDHPMVQFQAPIYNNTPVEAFPELTIPQIFQVITEQEGPLATSSGLYTYISTKSNADRQWPNIVITNRVAIFSSNITEIIEDFSAQRSREWADYYGPYLGQPFLVLDIFLRKIKSKGRVRLSSANPFSPPIIDPNFLSYEQELEDMVEAVKFELYFIENSKISENVFLIPKAIPGCSLCPDRPIYECDSYIRCYIRQIGDKEHHSCGTCKMGDKNRADTVVDPHLRVKHVAQLRVCDASVMPYVPNSNTHAATVMIGEKCAHLIREDNQY